MSTAAKKANPYTIRTLKAGEPIPAGEPHRYPSSHGYVRLRWSIAPYQLVEVYEHRVVDGRVTDAEQVHHRNGDKADNARENLEPLTQIEHRHAHRKVDTERIVALYATGMSTPQVGAVVGLDASQVWRRLKDAGVEPRSLSESQRLTLDEDRLRVLHSQGRRATAIASELGVSPSCVRSRMRILGLPAFAPGRPTK